MDWGSLISTVIGSGVIFTAIGSAVTFLYFRKQNKQLKNNEVKSTDLDIEEKQVEIDSKQIDLGREFMKASLEMTKQMQDMMTENQQRNDSNWNSMFQRMDTLEDSVLVIRLYLNGGLSEFEENMKKQKNNGVKKNTKSDCTVC